MILIIDSRIRGNDCITFSFMLGYLILIFTLVPAIELYLLLEIGAVIGAANTFLIIIFTGVLGAYLARIQGFLVLNKIQTNVNQGIMPSQELLDGLMILVGGIVLLTPGFITDAMGFLLLIPWTRQLIRALVKRKFESMIRDGQVISMRRSSHRFQDRDDYDDIDLN